MKSQPLRLLAPIEVEAPTRECLPDIFNLRVVLKSLIQRAYEQRARDSDDIFTTDADAITHLYSVPINPFGHNFLPRVKPKTTEMVAAYEFFMSNAAHQILHGKRRVDVVLQPRFYGYFSQPGFRDAILDEFAGIREEMQRYIPSLRIQGIECFRRSYHPYFVPKYSRDPRLDAPKKMSGREWQDEWYPAISYVRADVVL